MRCLTSRRLILLALCNCLDYQKSASGRITDGTLLEKHTSAGLPQDVRHGIKSPVWSDMIMKPTAQDRADYAARQRALMLRFARCSI